MTPQFLQFVSIEVRYGARVRQLVKDGQAGSPHRCAVRNECLGNTFSVARNGEMDRAPVQAPSHGRKAGSGVPPPGCVVSQGDSDYLVAARRKADGSPSLAGCVVLPGR